MPAQDLFIAHRRPGPLVRAQLLARPNRFLGVVRLPDGREVEAHIGDRGRLEGILYPGAEIYVVPAQGPARRTGYTVVCARLPALSGGGPGPLGCLDPAFANHLVRVLLEARVLAGLPRYAGITSEVRVGGSRFDFALALAGRRAGRLLLEVKSAAVAAGQAALFPDAPSERAARHCHELAVLSRAGEATAIVMVAQRPDVAEIRPHPVDPRFAEALRAAKQAGVRLLGAAFEVSTHGFRFAGQRPVYCEAP